MSYTLDFAVDGFDLNDDNGKFFVLDGTTVMGEIVRRSVSQPVPGMDGEIPYYQETYEPTQLGIKIAANSGLGKTAEEVTQAIVALFNKTTATVLTKTMEGHSVQADVKFSNMVEISRDDTGTRILFTIVVRIPGVWFRDIVLQEFVQTAPVSGTEYVVLTGGTFPINDPLIRLTGPLTTPTLTDVGSGCVITLPTIPDGSSVIMDASTGVAWFGPTASGWTLTGFTDYTSQVRSSGPGSAMRMFRLTPRPTTDIFNTETRIKIAHGAAPTINSSLQVRARRCYL